MNMDNSRKIAFRAWDDRAKKMLIGQSMMNKTLAQLDTWSDRVMQFTGLLDKSGKEIYEGDLFQDDEDGSCDVVEWDNEQSGWCTQTWYSVGEFADSTRYHEIIGNVFENPELIK